MLKNLSTSECIRGTWVLGVKCKRISALCGLKVSALSLGTWHLPRLPEKDEVGAYKIDVEEFRKVLKVAFDNGVFFIDTANRYHGGMAPVDLRRVGYAERLLGDLLKEYERQELVIATKVAGRMGPGPNDEGLSRKHVLWQISESLRRLNTDYVDIYYMHRYDPEVPKYEVLRTFDSLVQRGKVLYVGASNVPATELVEFMELSERLRVEPITVLQYKYNIIERDIERDIVPVARRYGLGIAVYSPLAQGVLTGKYVDLERGKWRVPELSRASYMRSISETYFTEKNLKFLLRFMEFSRSLDLTPAQLALAWTVNMEKRLGVTIVPIISVSRLSHLQEAIEAVEVKLSHDDLKYLDEISRDVVK